MHAVPKFFGLFAHPDSAVIITADPAEVVIAQTKQRAIIEHAAVWIAHGRINDLTHGEFSDIARQHVLHQGFRIRADDLKFAQG